MVTMLECIPVDQNTCYAKLETLPWQAWKSGYT